jgi:hypothetical protein
LIGIRFLLTFGHIAASYRGAHDSKQGEPTRLANPPSGRAAAGGCVIARATFLLGLNARITAGRSKGWNNGHRRVRGWRLINDSRIDAFVRNAPKAAAGQDVSRRDGPCVDGSGLARVFFT